MKTTDIVYPCEDIECFINEIKILKGQHPKQETALPKPN